MFNLSERDFLELVESSSSLTILQTRMAKLGFTLGESFRQTVLSDSFKSLSTTDKVSLVREVYGAKALAYILLSLEHTEYLATVEAREQGVYKNIVIPREPIKYRVKNTIGASLTSVLKDENYLQAGLTLRAGIEQSFLLPSRTLAPKAMGIEELVRLIFQGDACKWCVSKSGKRYRIESKDAMHFHDSCRCIVKTVNN